jgi:hypothetical protein
MTLVRSQARQSGAVESAPRAAAPLVISEQAIRELVKAKIPRLIRNVSQALLIEEMEVCAGRARIDIAVIADYLLGIEIKGPKDDVARLPNQVKAYSQCFDRVVLIVHQTLAPKALPLIPSWWGVVIGEQKGCRIGYSFERRPEANPSLNLDSLLALLWREEIVSMFSEFVGEPASAKASKKKLRAELISQFARPTLHSASLQKLRQRKDWRTTPIHD